MSHMSWDAMVPAASLSVHNSGHLLILNSLAVLVTHVKPSLLWLLQASIHRNVATKTMRSHVAIRLARSVGTTNRDMPTLVQSGSIVVCTMTCT